jgi:hypothetical protein
MKTKSLIITLLVAMPIMATESYNEPSQHRWSASFGGIEFTDPVFEGYKFEGVSFGLSASHAGYYKGSHQKLSWEVYDYWTYNIASNSTLGSTNIAYLTGNIGFGSYNHWRPTKNFVLNSGLIVECFGGIKSLTTTDKASLDFQTQLLLYSDIRYTWWWQNWGLGISYKSYLNVLGMMIEPNTPQSLYALQKGIDANDIYFTSFHNRQGVKTDLALLFIFNNITLQTTFIYDSHWWQLNQMQKSYTRKLTCEIGVIINLKPILKTEAKTLFF